MKIERENMGTSQSRLTYTNDKAVPVAAVPIGGGCASGGVLARLLHVSTA